MKERIKIVRNNANATQEEFANKIGISKSSVSLLESGRNNPSEQTIRAICDQYNINRVWLETGEGEMFADARDDFELITRAMAGTSEGKKRVMRIIAGMPDELLDKILDYLETKK